jgi:signal transduction histidine kinase
MKLRVHIQPRFVVAATVAVAVLMIGTALIELRQAREELYHLMGEGALALAETIDRSGANNLLSMDKIEDLLAGRLLDNAMYIAQLDGAGLLRSGDLASYAAKHHLYRINIFNRRGARIMSSHSPSVLHSTLPEKFSPADVLSPILQGKADHLVIGLKEARLEQGQRFAVAVRRIHPAGGAIVVNLDAADLLSFRRVIGIGKLLKDLGNNSGIAYVALQDTQGIMAASGGVRELSSINADTLIMRAIATETTITRVLPFAGMDVFEVVRPFAPGGAPIGVLRIGLAMDEVRNAEILGLRSDEVEGRAVNDLVEGSAAMLKEIFAGSDGSLEMSVMLSDDIRRIIEVSLSTIHDAAGTIESRSAIVRDLTEARHLERDMQRNSKLTAMGELASGVAHEIRNPLNAIAMIAQRFTREFTPRSGVKEYRTLTTVMHEETRRVNAIIQQFLAFARPPKVVRRQTHVPDIINHVASLFASQAKGKAVTFVASAEGAGAAPLDPEQMQQALLNLLQNALDATPQGGCITLTATAVPQGIRFVVADSGSGMPGGVLENSFNLYYTTKAHGTGLGLPITQQIVAQHGGAIDVASVEGKGTTFTIVVPSRDLDSNLVNES